jgi:Ca2+-binding RTX toxin-like protein
MATLIGGIDADSLTGAATTAGDVIFGNGGADTLRGLLGTDTIAGGDGNDLIEGGAGSDRLSGGAGNDTFLYTSIFHLASERITDFTVGDRLDFSAITAGAVSSFTWRFDFGFSGAGNEFRMVTTTIDTSTPATQIQFDVDGDTLVDHSLFLVGTLRLEQIAPGILAIAAPVIQDGTVNGETLNGGFANDTLRGNGGNDSLVGSDGNDLMEGGAGADTIDPGFGTDTLAGGGGNDVFRFTSYASFGGDTIRDMRSADRIDLTALNGIVYVGDALFTGLAGELRFTSFSGAVQLQLDSDGDRLADRTVTVNAVPGLEETSTGSRILRAVFGLETTGTGAGETLTGSGGPDSLVGLEGDDVLRGLFGPDTLNGDAGADSLLGGSGNDLMNGGDGNDTLVGGDGNDFLTGGAGNDVFRVASLTEIGLPVFPASTSVVTTSWDTINDFQLGDVLDLSAIAGIAFIGEVPFNNVAGEMALIGSQLGVDVDGDGDADAGIVFSGIVPALAETAPGSRILVAVASVVQSGTTGADSLTGGVNTDTLSGLAGADTLVGGARADSLSGGTENDVLIGGAGNDTLLGGEGNDVFRWLALGDVAQTGSFITDTIRDFSLADRLDLSALSGLTFAGATLSADDAGEISFFLSEGSTGGSTLVSVTSEDGLVSGTIVLENFLAPLVETAPGNRILVGVPSIVSDGGAIGDSLTGGAASDTLRGFGGADTLTGGGLRDLLEGGTGNDLLRGEAGGDTLIGGDDADTLDGGAGFDRLQGGEGNDTLLGGTESDTLEGGGGDDLLDAGSNASGFSGDSMLGGDGNDTLLGGAQSDSLLGGNGADTMVGGAGNDSLNGGDGNDTLLGGAGNDTMAGGTGNDVFRYLAIDELQSIAFVAAAEAISDFATGDVIDLSALAGLSFIGDAAFTGVAGQFRFATTFFSTSSGTALQFDMNGDGLFGSGDRMIALTGLFSPALEETAPGSLVLRQALPVNLPGTPAAETLAGGAANDTLSGADGNDTLLGNGGNDTMFGGNDADSLVGGNGNDSMNGGAGNDTLFGGAGNDTADASGGGDDRVVFSTIDEIGQFESVVGLDAGDQVDFTAIAGLSFIGSNLFSGIAGQVRWDIFSGQLFIDIDANGDGIEDRGLTLNTFNFLNLPLDMLTPGVFGVVAPRNLLGTATGETLTGAANNDSLAGEGGNDTLLGFGAADTLTGGEGNDVLTGGAGDDRMTGGTGNDSFVFLAFTDLQTSGGSQREIVLDFAAGDRLDFSAIANFSYIGTSAFGFTPGQARLTTTNFFGFLVPTLDIDTDGNGFVDRQLVLQGYTGALEETAPGSRILVAPTPLNLAGTAAAETLTGGALNDTLSGAGGADTLLGNGGADSLDGGNFNDVLRGGEGNDTLFGGVGDDTLSGGTGGDLLTGGGGNDVFAFGTGDVPASPLVDTVADFGTGDVIDLTGFAGLTWRGTGPFLLAGGVQARQDGAFIRLDLDGNTTSDASIAITAFTGGLEETAAGSRILRAVNALNLTGGTGADTLTGASLGDTLNGAGGNDLLIGNGGADSLDGGAGNDVLQGGDGADTLIGGAGADTMSGGANSDRFVYANGASGTGAQRDVILDFVSGSGDLLDFTLMDANLDLAGEQDFVFIGAAAFTGLGQLRLTADVLQGNITGTTTADFQIVLTGVTALLPTDYAL